MRRQRPRGSQLGLILLASQLFQVGLDNVPPVTLGVLGLNVYLYLFPAAPLLQACVSVQNAYWRGDWRRLFLSPFHHADDWHLYFNLTSFLWKGINLERRMGGAWFLYVLSVFSLLTGLVYLGLEAGLTLLTDDHSYSVQCAVGFSGVLFALKILNNHYHPGGVTHVLGLAVDNRYASWVELVLIHLTNPGTSLIGHLAGILVGLLYTKGPLKSMMKNCAALVTGPSRYTQPNYSYSGYSGTRSGGPAGGGYAAHWRDNAGGMTEQEQLDQALRNSMNDTEPRPGDGAPPPYGFHLSDEEVRRRRLRRLLGMPRDLWVWLRLALLKLTSLVTRCNTPVSLCVIVLNACFYWFSPFPVMEVCVSVQEVYWHGDWPRLFLSPFHHFDVWHLVHSTSSLLLISVDLERRMGGAWFLYVLYSFSLLTRLVAMALGAGLTELMDDHSYSLHCRVGFSGALNGLALLRRDEVGVTYVWGRVNSRHYDWMIRFYITLMSSFIDILVGLLVGFLYITGPLKYIMMLCAGGSRPGE